jgi:hypothetical protein
MFDEYSIEQRATQITHPKTKEYFSEVLSSYSAGNYRSSVVMLWSVAVCDLLFKLEFLKEIYQDDKAEEILNKIKAYWEKNKTSSEWEGKLVDLVEEKTELLDRTEKNKLLHLQEQRHLAAHPILNQKLELHAPNRDEVRALIRNTLDSLLIKDAFLSKNIFNELTNDLEKLESSNPLLEDKDLKLYLESSYFQRFNSAVEQETFKSFWSIVFHKTNEQCNKNREINYRTLKLLFERNPPQFKKQIEENRHYFSKIAHEESPLVYLIQFLSKNASIYALLTDDAKVKLEQVAKKDNTARCLACFIYPSLHVHAQQINEWMQKESPRIDSMTWQAMRDISDSSEWDKEFIKLANTYYANSPSFDEAAQRFKDLIQPLLPKYQRDDCKDILMKIKDQYLVWGRRDAQEEHELLISGLTADESHLLPTDNWLIEKANEHYASSGSFDTADKRFTDAIQHLLPKYEISHLQDLLTKIANNNQTYGRGKAYRDHEYIIDRILELNPAFDFDLYKPRLFCLTEEDFFDTIKRKRSELDVLDDIPF